MKLHHCTTCGAWISEADDDYREGIDDPNLCDMCQDDQRARR